MATTTTPTSGAADLPAIISGALFDFAGFLTTLPKERAVTLSGAHPATPVADLLTEWAKTRGLNLDEANAEDWEAALTAAPAAQQAPQQEDACHAPPCDSELFESGVSVGLFDMPKWTAEALCKGIAAATGARVDWHYIGGRVHVKALPAPASAEGAAYAALPDEVVRLAQVAIRECQYKGNDMPQDWMESAMHACRLIAASHGQAPAGAGELAEADRRAGAAERKLAASKEDVARIERVRDKMKDQWGVDRRVSFDVVWAEALALKAGTKSDSVQEDAARYRFLRDGEWRDTDLEPFIRLQLNTLWDAKIDAARKQGEKQ